MVYFSSKQTLKLSTPSLCQLDLSIELWKTKKQKQFVVHFAEIISIIIKFNLHWDLNNWFAMVLVLVHGSRPRSTTNQLVKNSYEERYESRLVIALIMSTSDRYNHTDQTKWCEQQEQKIIAQQTRLANEYPTWTRNGSCEYV